MLGPCLIVEFITARMKLSMLLFGVAALAAPQGAVAVHPTWDQLDDYSFERFQRDFGKFYESPAEHVRRAKIFETNLAAVRKHNAENHSWRKGVNTFTDMTEEERLQATAGIDRNVFFAEQVGCDTTLSPLFFGFSFLVFVSHRVRWGDWWCGC